VPKRLAQTLILFLESTLWTNGKARIDLIGRGGVFLNRMELGFRAGDPDDADVSLFFKRQTDKTAFASDLQTTLFIPLGPSSLRIGHQIFWVNKAALLPNQLDSFDFINDTDSFNFSSPVYQGGFIGLEIPF